MRNGTAYLGYDLYESFGAATPWDGESGTGAATTQSINVFGRIPSGQSGLTAGTYTDTVVVTVTY
jgi:spore coat protein U-like protein